MKLQTGISPKYVKGWDVEKAIREIIQNYLDTRKEFGCSGRITWKEGIATIKDDGPGLELKHLALGVSEKSADAIGKYGEGLKLALLVMAREGRWIEVRASGKIITPAIKYHEGFGTEILVLNVEDMKPRAAKNHIGTAIRFECSREELEKGKSYFEHFLTSSSSPREERITWLERGKISLPAGNIYINGARVGRVENALFSYHLSERETGDIGNRDREVVNHDKVRLRVRNILAETSSFRVMEQLIAAASYFPETWEVSIGVNYLLIPTERFRAWKRAAHQTLGKNAVISSGDEDIDAQARYTGHEVIRVRSWSWEAALKHVGVNTAEKAAKSRASAKRVSLRDLTPEEKRILNEAKRLVEENYGEVGTVIVAEEFASETGNAKVEGCYRRGEDKIYLKRSVLGSLPHALHTLLHETVHRHSGADDCTADFERALADVSVEIMLKRKEAVAVAKKKKEKAAVERKKDGKDGQMTRIQAAALAIQAIDGETTVEDLIAVTDEIAMENGLTSNVNESRTQIHKALQTAIVFGIVERDGDVVRKK